MKIVCVINLLSIVVLWIPELIAIGDGVLEAFFEAILIVFSLYALQGLLLFVRNLGKWDLISAAAIPALTIYYAVSGQEITFLWLGTPMILYLVLQFIRNKIPDTLKVLYLNSWNMLIVFMYLLDRYTSLI